MLISEKTFENQTKMFILKIINLKERQSKLILNFECPDAAQAYVV
jgi:hypothetical protein